MIEEVKKQVSQLLGTDKSGHGMEHINRVLNLSLEFAKKEKANIEEVSLIALLHDVDDYKLFGEENAKNLTNAKRIMNEVGIPLELQLKVIDNLKCIGYSKSLIGLRPTSIEGKIVSDADMCDGLGAIGIIRGHSYGIKVNRPFFDKNIFPKDEGPGVHNLKGTASTVNFIIANLLKYKYVMLTKSGRVEAEKREKTLLDFLYNYFAEENVPNWIEYLNKVVKDLKINNRK